MGFSGQDYNGTDKRFDQHVALTNHLLLEEKKLSYCWVHKVLYDILLFFSNYEDRH
jgi:hypothetical protein